MSFDLDGTHYVVTWSISTFDRQKKKLPLETVHYRLVGEDLSEEQCRQIVAILDNDSDRLVPSSRRDVVITISSSVRRDCSAIIKYRSLFRRQTQDDCDWLGAPKARPLRLLSIPMLDRYVEDETGNPITMTQVIRIVSGHAQVVLMGDIESVLLVGPANPKDESNWTREIANQFDQFFRLVEQISRGSWLRAPVSISYSKEQPDVRESKFPISDQTRSVATLFRQLYSSDSSDNLFNTVCNRYLQFCSLAPKQAWVKYEKDLFNKALLEPPSFPPGAVSTPVRQLLDAILYGARILHARPKRDAVAELDGLLAQYGQDKLKFAFHSALRELLSHAYNVSFPMRQDFDHWIKNGFAPPDQGNLSTF